MSVILKQFDGGAISPRDDAILYNSIIQRNGIFNGCEITHLGANQLKITAGRGIIKGRTFEIEEMTVNCQLASYGTQKGRMYLRMELSNLEAPIQIKTVAATSLPDLVQEEDCNYTNGVYEMELCTYNVTDVLISDLKMTYDAIDTAFPIARSLEEAEGVTDPDVLANALSVGQLSRDLTANGTNFIFDYQNGKYGYNTNPNRGADTFYPFSQLLIPKITVESPSGNDTTNNVYLDFENKQKVTIFKIAFIREHQNRNAQVRVVKLPEHTIIYDSGKFTSGEKTNVEVDVSAAFQFRIELTGLYMYAENILIE